MKVLEKIRDTISFIFWMPIIILFMCIFGEHAVFAGDIPDVIKSLVKGIFVKPPAPPVPLTQDEYEEMLRRRFGHKGEKK